MKTRAIKGHEFGLNLNPTEREQLIAFLRTLLAGLVGGTWGGAMRRILSISPDADKPS